MLRKLGLALALVILVGAGVAGWLWQEATALPEWYAEGSDVPLDLPQEDGAGPPAPAGWSVVPEANPVAEGAEERPRVRRRELRNFHVEALAREKAFRAAVRGSRAVFEDGRLEAGVVIDTSKIPRDRLGGEGRELHDRARRVFPGLRDRRIYLGIEDRPVTIDGFLQLGAQPQIRVGELRYSLKRAAKKLGISEKRLRRDVNRLFRKLELVDPDAPPVQ